MTNISLQQSIMVSVRKISEKTQVNKIGELWKVL